MSGKESSSSSSMSQKRKDGGWSSSFTCALTGERNIVDPVATPSGYVCSRKFLLNVLLENKGKDPFDDDENKNDLEESQLVDLHLACKAPPTMVTTAGGGISSLLSQLDQEYNGVLMELFTTKRALQQTKEELSTALYQQDAAIRVIARLSMERDEARSQLQHYITTNNNNNNNNKKRNREDVTDEEPPMKKTQEEETTVSLQESQVQIMVDTWQRLSAERKAMKKATAIANYDTLTSTDVENKEECTRFLGTAKGTIWAMLSNHTITIIHPQSSSSSIPLADTLSACDILALPSSSNNNNNQWMLVFVTQNGDLEIHTQTDGKTCETQLQLNQDKLVDIQIHPSGHFLFLTFANGTITILSTNNDNKNTQLCAKFHVDTNNNHITCARLHPDGLLHAIGTSDGKILLMEVKSQSLASTLELPDKDVSVDSISFSENGYHLVTTTTTTTATNEKSSSMQLWDLRKQKLLHSMDGVTAAAFDVSGKYIAMVSSSDISIASVKDWNKSSTTLTSSSGPVSSLVWTNDVHQVLLTTTTTNNTITTWKSSDDPK